VTSIKNECELPMRRITKGRTAIAYSEYVLENTSLVFRDLYELPGPGSVRSSRNMENKKKTTFDAL
jgi:hypothetical protein